MQSLWLRGDVELSVDSRLTGESEVVAVGKDVKAIVRSTDT